LYFLYSFRYEAAVDNGLIEHELDHIFWAVSDETPTINIDEVLDYKYITPEELREDMKKRPDIYTEWFKICLDEVLSKIKL